MQRGSLSLSRQATQTHRRQRTAIATPPTPSRPGDDAYSHTRSQPEPTRPCDDLPVALIRDDSDTGWPDRVDTAPSFWSGRTSWKFRGRPTAPHGVTPRR